MCVRFSIWLSGCGSSWAAWLLVQTPWQPAGSGMRWRRRQMVAEMWRFQLDWRLSPQLFQRRWCFTSQTIVMISLISCVHFNLARSANLPTGLYILSSLISFFFNWAKLFQDLYWTDFHDLYTKWKVFVWMLSIRFIFSNSSRDVAMATNFVS